MDTSHASASRSREPLIGGLVLISVGTILLLAQFVPDISRYMALVVGLGLLGLFLAKRDYGLLVAGGIVTGVGAGILIAAAATGNLSGAGFMLSLGTGFLGIWAVSSALRMEERHWWPLVPGLILVSIGSALAVGGSALDLISLWPVALIVIGVALLGRWYLTVRRAS
ncbi:hypothetical protein BH24CHL6_BH24CHL6_08340 [soil metagenome]